jgi:hypothetical protein
MNATSNACLNCESPLAEAQRFCGSCGQKNGPARLTMSQIAHDFFHAITHVDHSIFALVKALAVRPGHVARDYVEGRRKKYFGPFAFLVLAVGLASFMIVLTGVPLFAPIADSGAGGFLQRHINLVILVQMPFLAACCVLLFWTARLHYAEHLVLVAYTSGFRILFLALIGTPVLYFTHLRMTDRGVIPVYFGLWAIYFAVAAVQFYRGAKASIVFRSVIAAVLSQALTMGLFVVFIILFTLYIG